MMENECLSQLFETEDGAGTASRRDLAIEMNESGSKGDGSEIKLCFSPPAPETLISQPRDAATALRPL